MAPKKYPSVLLWVDIETTGITDTGDYDPIEILEIAVVATDFDLVPYFGYEGIVQMNDAIKAQLGRPENKAALDMHLESGLLKASKESTDTLQIIESEIVGMLTSKTTQERGEVSLAGSGVTAFDHPLIKKKLPKLNEWLTYYSFDIGSVRRAARILSGGRDVVSPTRESFQEGVKAHRALADVKAHIKEANEFKKLFRWIVEEQTKA
jgi:oligoribonuclease (3'-5' exoribonuclease)